MRLILAALMVLPIAFGPPANAADGFRVTLLGTGTPTPSMERFGPSTLVEAGGHTLLFDAGRGVPIRLSQLHIPGGRLETLFLTHFHSDHTSGIPDVWLTGWTVRDSPRTTAFHVVGPTGTKALMRDLRTAYARDIETRVADEGLPREGARVVVKEFAHDGVVYDKDGVTVTAFAVDHGPKIKPAYGYRIDYQGHSAVISGDTRYSPNLIRHAMGVDLLIHEVMVDPVGPLSPALKAVQDHHSSPSDAGRVFTATMPKLAVYSHIVVAANPAVTPDQLERSTRATYAGPLEVGADLTSFDIADTVVVHRWKP